MCACPRACILIMERPRALPTRPRRHNQPDRHAAQGDADDGVTLPCQGSQQRGGKRRHRRTVSRGLVGSGRGQLFIADIR